MPLELLIDAFAQGILLGGFYAAVSLGLAIAFGMLDVPHVAHPTVLVLGAYGTYLASQFGMDPLLAGLMLMPLFFILGVGLYRFYHVTFERRGSDQGLRGITFFFGFAFVIEVLLILLFGVDQRLVQAPYIGKSLAIGDDLRLPWRMIAALVVALAMVGALHVFFARSFAGRAIKAVAQDEVALQLIGADPVKVKRLAFGLATAAAAMAGALLIVVGPVDPQLGRLYIGRTFCVVVLAGMGSVWGTLVAGLILGIAESVVLGSGSTTWTPAVAFGLLLVALALRPAGLFGRGARA
ncbi:branched-chain amino acid ABC transporter permease [Variovorax sp. WS11]|uniref:branched-chain amino acid ABC transporter permease n=1 Tax=Variovorax sp. WS11 TaxID=1105204 RepID=UPI000D0D9AB8|nr:branched-chain amino acid ABC transporter permease [Variovorax sp. WS11]NDZ17569.1 branched-chain amino acid ABC transporter permease [Variovorax sp. WS11]PSL82226.1 branched-chain amino acid ABC transporter permease [Variovorax sp. WS11]